MGTRESYARLCIQVDLTKSLITAVRVGKLRQKVLYEGIASLCFCCGRLGHKLENCSYRVQPTAKTGEVDPASHAAFHDDGKCMEQPKDTNYGEWMLVTKKKRPIQMGRGIGNKSPSQQPDTNSRPTKGKKGFSSSSLTPFSPELTFQFKAGQALGAVEIVGNTSEPRDLVGSYTPNRRVEGAKRSSNVNLSALSCEHDVQLEQRTDQIKRKGKATLSSHDKKSLHAKGIKSLKRPNPEPPSSQKAFSFEGSFNATNVSF